MRVEKRSSSGIALCARNNSSCLIEKQFPNEIFWCAWTIHVWKTILKWELFRLIRDVPGTILRVTVSAIGIFLCPWNNSSCRNFKNDPAVKIRVVPETIHSGWKTLLTESSTIWLILYVVHAWKNSSLWKTILKWKYVVLAWNNSCLTHWLKKRFSRLKLKWKFVVHAWKKFIVFENDPEMEYFCAPGLQEQFIALKNVSQVGICGAPGTTRA